jgi:hypothetical protein
VVTFVGDVKEDTTYRGVISLLNVRAFFSVSHECAWDRWDIPWDI